MPMITEIYYANYTSIKYIYKEKYNWIEGIQRNDLLFKTEGRWGWRDGWEF